VAGFWKGILSRRPRSLEDLGLSRETIRQIAYHEAGHVLATHLCGDGDTLVYASLIPERKCGYGLVKKMPNPHFMLTSTRRELENAIVVKLAGRAAEEVIFGKDEISTGCGHDLAAATSVATKMVAFWGFSEGIGLVSIDLETAAGVLEVREEAGKILATQYAKALDIIGESRHALNDMAASLIEKRFLTAEDIRRTLGKSASL
jgi:cell division protease FtsH